MKTIINFCILSLLTLTVTANNGHFGVGFSINSDIYTIIKTSVPQSRLCFYDRIEGGKQVLNKTSNNNGVFEEQLKEINFIPKFAISLKNKSANTGGRRNVIPVVAPFLTGRNITGSNGVPSFDDDWDDGAWASGKVDEITDPFDEYHIYIDPNEQDIIENASKPFKFYVRNPSNYYRPTKHDEYLWYNDLDMRKDRLCALVASTCEKPNGGEPQFKKSKIIKIITAVKFQPLAFQGH